MPVEKPAHPDNVAIDSNGKLLPYSPEQVRAITARAIQEGRLVLGVVETGDGNLCCHVAGEPSKATADILDAVAKAYRASLRGH